MSAEWVAILIASLSLVVTGVHVGWNIRIHRQDVPDLRTKATLVRYKHDPDDEPIPSHLKVRLVNQGRRPISLVTFWIDFGGSLRGHRIVRHGRSAALRLEEHDVHEQEIQRDDLFDLPEGTQAEDLFVEDATGTRIPVANAREALTEMWSWPES